MSILKLSAEVIKPGDTQANLISDRIKTSETVWGVAALGWGAVVWIIFSIVSSTFATMWLLYNCVIFAQVIHPIIVQECFFPWDKKK